MEIRSSSFTTLTFQDDSSDLQKMEQKAAQVLQALVKIRESVGNVLMVKLTIEVNIGPDSDILHCEWEDKNYMSSKDQRATVQVQQGDRIRVTAPDAKDGRRSLFGEEGVVSSIPNNSNGSDIYFVKFPFAELPIGLFRREFEVVNTKESVP